jgi:hypothetical protein
VITDIPADAQIVYARIYAQRGDVENRIKELHDGIRIDRLASSRFLANRARLLLYAGAFGIYQALRRVAAGTSLARAHRRSPHWSRTSEQANPETETRQSPGVHE